MFSILQKSLHSSPFLPNPLCLSAFREVKSHQQLFTHSSPPSTSLFIGIPEGLVKSEEYFRVCFHIIFIGQDYDMTTHLPDFCEPSLRMI